MEKVAKNGRKVKGIGLLFRLFFENKKVAKIGRKVEGHNLTFLPFFKNKKSGSKWTKR
jgi:hypothetical protein